MTTEAIPTSIPWFLITPPTPAGSLCPAWINTNTYSDLITSRKSYIGFVRWIGVEEFGPGIISYTHEYFYDEKYGLVAIFFKNNYTIWLEELICRDKSGAIFLKVIDEVKIPPLAENEIVRFFCSYQATITPDATFVAIGHFVDQQNSKIVATRGWQVDFDNQRFVELSTKQVQNLTCN